MPKDDNEKPVNNEWLRKMAKLEDTVNGGVSAGRPTPTVNWSEILGLVNTVRTARTNGHPDWGKHLDTLLALLEKHGRNS